MTYSAGPRRAKGGTINQKEPPEQRRALCLTTPNDVYG